MPSAGMSETLLRAKRWRTSQPGPFSASRFLLFCGMDDSSIGDRKSGALVRFLAKVSLARKLSPCEYRRRTFAYPALYQLCAVFSSKLMVLTGKVSLCTTAVVLPGVNTVPGTKVSVLKGRRGPRGPGPGRVLLIRCALCRWKPREPM